MKAFTIVFVLSLTAFIQVRTTTFSNNRCRKEDLRAEYGAVEISCDTEEHNPVATTCDVTIPCDNNYVQYRTQKTCIYGFWDGDIRCLPDVDLLGRCTYDFESMETNGDCPFHISEVVEYYIDMEDADPYDKGALLGRSSRKTVRCGRICAKRRGSFTFNCPRSRNRRNKDTYVKCMICRIHQGCRGTKRWR